MTSEEIKPPPEDQTLLQQIKDLPSGFILLAVAWIPLIAKEFAKVWDLTGRSWGGISLAYLSIVLLSWMICFCMVFISRIKSESIKGLGILGMCLVLSCVVCAIIFLIAG